jgi:hypothetical protein
MLKTFLALALAATGLAGCYGLIDQSGGGGGGTSMMRQQDDQDWATDEQGIWDAGERPKPRRHRERQPR